MIRQTSLLAYNALEVTTLTERYSKILQALRKSPDMTDCEIAHMLGYYDPNKVRPRRNELVKYGLVGESQKRKCHITGKTAITWYVTDLGVISREGI